jgi:hypothetical protein
MADITATPSSTTETPEPGAPRAQTAAERRSTAAKKAAATRARNRTATARETAQHNAERKAAATRAGNRAATARETAQHNAERKAAATRAGNRAATARETAQHNAERKAAAAETRSTAGRVQGYAERAMLVQVGATLIARDAIASTVEGLRAKYSTPEKAQRELARFGRRGATARAQVERELRERRSRVENAVQGGLSAGAQVAAKVQQRVAGLV